MTIPKFLKPFVTKEALIGWAIAFHQKIWRLVELGGDVDFITTYAGKAWTFFSADWGTWLVVAFGLGLVGHSYFRHSKRPEEIPAEEETKYVPERQYASPFAGKTPAAPEPTPQRLINVIDSQDEHLSGFINASRIWIRKHFEAANPYMDIHIELVNNSVFELTFEGFQGRFFYRDDPLKDRPEIISHDEKIGPNSHSSYTVRQFINSDFCDVLANHRHQRQELALSENFCIKFSYLNRGGEKKEAYWPLMRDPIDLPSG